MIATKEAERNTLEKIRKMVAELGENSYLAAAFTGAFEIAERNIDDDAAYTTQYYIDQAHTAEGKYQKQLQEMKTARQNDQNKIKLMQTNIEDLNKEIERLQTKLADILQKEEYWRVKATMQESMILTLKAKLYDYMTAVK
ncbi:MAG: hypothetical protein HPY66_3149 [Firmicutes bacterium]|nr:hypothetical protein [Bacillota bacterium]MDI6706149.1 hypothetical protein [Bacillota bacterium]